MASETSSMEKSMLTSVNGSLGELRAFQSAHSLCDKTVDRYKNLHEMSGVKFDGFGLMGKILSFKDEVYLGTMHIDSLVAEITPKDPEETVLFLQELLTTARQFSTTLFNGNQDRMKILDAVQAAVDIAVDAEDQWLASME